MSQIEKQIGGRGHNLFKEQFTDKNQSKLEFLEHQTPFSKMKRSYFDSLKCSKISTKIDQSLMNMSTYDAEYCQIEEKV